MVGLKLSDAYKVMRPGRHYLYFNLRLAIRGPNAVQTRCGDRAFFRICTDNCAVVSRQASGLTAMRPGIRIFSQRYGCERRKGGVQVVWKVARQMHI